MNRENKVEYNNYMANNHINRYRRLRREAIVLLGSSCWKCGDDKYKNLQLDHKNKHTKEFNVSTMLNVSLDKFWKEVKKCQVLCKKCHNEKTIKERGYKIARGNHGTISTYRYCKCDLCRNAWNKHSREYRKKKRAGLA